MTSKREEIMAYVATALLAVDGVGGRVYRSRPEAVSRAEAPAVLVEPIQSTADYNNIETIEWNLQFKVTAITRGASPDVLADPIVNSIYSIIMADRTLNGRALDVIPQGVFFKITDGDNPIGVTDCVFTVRHRTSSNSLEA